MDATPSPLGASCLALLLGALPGVSGDARFFNPVTPPRPFQVMVHRGERLQAPENTRPALQRCIDDGLEWAGVDVRLSGDGHHLLSDPETLTRPDGSPVPIASTPLADLQRVDVGSRIAVRYAGEHPLTLQEALALAKGRLNLCLDCKAVDPELLCREVVAAGMERQVLVCADGDLLRRLQAASHGRVSLMTQWRPAQGEPSGKFLKSTPVAAVQLDAPDATPARCREFHALGVAVQVKVLGAWDAPSSWDSAIAAGADILQTDLPEELLPHAFWRRVPNRPVRFSLHRGANRYAPENTLPAFEKGIRLGADFVEFDVRTTRDGKFYLLHNDTLEGKTTGHGPIADTPSDVIETLSAGVKFNARYRDLHLPTLEAFLSTVQGKIDLYFDAKAIAPEALAEAVGRHQMAERTVVYQSAEYLLKLKAIDPRIRALPPLDSPGEIEKLAAGLKPYGVDASWEILSRELIERCHAHGIRVFSDALGKHERVEDYLQAMEWGIDVIQTDHPLRVLRAMELWESRKRP